MQNANMTPDPDGIEPDYETLDPDTVVSLTPQGRLYWEHMLNTLSEAAGRPISGDDLHEIVNRLRAETGQADPDFTDPAVMQCFLRHLRGSSGQ